MVVVHGLRGGRCVLLVLVVSGGGGEVIVESRRCPGRKLSGMVPREVVSVVVRARSQGHTPGSVRGRSKNLLRRMKGGGGSLVMGSIVDSFAFGFKLRRSRLVLSSMLSDIHGSMQQINGDTGTVDLNSLLKLRIGAAPRNEVPCQVSRTGFSPSCRP